MDWSDRMDLAEALLGLPGKLPSQYEDVTKLARIGGFIGLAGGLFLGALGYGLLAVCLATLAGALLGGCTALYFRRTDFAFYHKVKPTRKIEVARCVGCGIMTVAGIVATILKPNVLTIFGIFFFGWFTLRYFHRQQALAQSTESSRSSG